MATAAERIFAGSGLAGPEALSEAPWRQGEPAPRSVDGRDTSTVPGASANDSASDEALVERAQRGQRAAFDALVHKYQHRIAGLVAQYVRDANEVEDVTQEAFFKAYRGLARFRGESSFYTWLYRIAVNTAKNHLEAMSRRVTGQGVAAGEAERHEDGALLRHGDTPEREYRRDEVQRAIDRALDELPRHLRDAVMLREMQGLSYDAIARVMVCPVGTVRSRIARGRALIDEAVGPLIDSAEAGTTAHARA